MAMVVGGPGRMRRQARLTGEKRGGRGRWPRWLGCRRDYQGERETDRRHKVGRGAREQAPAGKNDHGDSERGGQGSGRRARVQAPVLRRELRRSEDGVVHEPPDCILVLSLRPLVLIIVTFPKYSTLYVPTFPLNMK